MFVEPQDVAVTSLAALRNRIRRAESPEQKRAMEAELNQLTSAEAKEGQLQRLTSELSCRRSLRLKTSMALLILDLTLM